MYQVKTDSGNVYEITGDLINGEAIDWDVIQLDDATYHVIKNNKTYLVQIIEVDAGEKKYSIRINGVDVGLELKDKHDLLLQKMGISSMQSKKIGDLKAPMPGLILDIQVAEGDAIEKGQPILILEAMKMENVLKSPGEGTVRKIVVQKGQAVEKGDLLIETD
jgi:biotin carboxyl carrier protein